MPREMYPGDPGWEPMRTPWGTADHITILADGVRRVDTPSHGGYKLDARMNRKVAEAWRQDGGWYEEDCDWAIVVITFPDLFPLDAIGPAHDTAINWYPDAYCTVTGTPIESIAERSWKLRQRAAEIANAEKWVVVSAFGSWHKAVPEGMVGVVTSLGGKRTVGTPTRNFLVSAEEYEKAAHDWFAIDPDRHQRWVGPDAEAVA